jgi:thiamine pyrophosphokinase
MNDKLEKFTDGKTTVILADGDFPWHKIPLDYLNNAARIICCDGSAAKLIGLGIIPDAIVGDMDSLDVTTAEAYPERIHRDDDQETNDLTKAVKWCVARGFLDLVILGATGRREDHTIGNISLLLEYSNKARVRMVTDTGIFIPIRESSEISSYPGQQVSVFSIDPETEITSRGLMYPLTKKKLSNWWVATLNEALSESFRLNFVSGKVIVYLKFN